MYYVYVLKSESKNWVYIGSCDDLRERVWQHNNGKVKSTKARKPYNLMYYEAYNTRSAARKREFGLKNNSSEKEELFRRIF